MGKLFYRGLCTVLRSLVISLGLAALCALPAAAHPNLGEDAFAFDLGAHLKISVQFDQSNPKTGKLDFDHDEDSDSWSLSATPGKYHGPDGVDGSALFVDRVGDLDNLTLKALRKGWLPLVRSLGPTENDDGSRSFIFEFATEVDVSQLINGGSESDEDDPELQFFADIAGTELITPAVIGQGHGSSATVSLVVPSVRRIVLAASAPLSLARSSDPVSGGPVSGADVPEPATALLLLPGLAWLVARRRRAGRA